MDGAVLVERLLAYAKVHLHLQECDADYMRNVLLSRFKLTAPYDGEADVSDVAAMDVPDALAEELSAYAVENGITDEVGTERFAADIFGILSPLPSAVNEEFSRIREEKGAQAACDYLYALCVKNGYIQKTAIGRNLKWDYQDGKNRLEITVNLSKPEKNNKDIAKLLTAPQGKKYPKCQLCKENEGFEGTATHPARRNLRTVKVTLGGEKWFVQYSPYAYYDEHCIAINEAHVPMNVGDRTPAKLLDFVDVFPNYFIGSNASLPIVGGSILNHEHFQGGLHLMPMHYAGYDKMYRSEEFPSLTIGTLDWYNTALRFEGKNREEAEAFAVKVISAWKDYSCPECDVICRTGDTQHNALSPIVRKVGDVYSFTMILRNNRTSEQFPDGIFHVHPEYQNIKSEGIGLIEAMGLFILPGRLKRQLESIAKILCGETPYDPASLEDKQHDLHIHRFMIEKLMSEGKSENMAKAYARCESYVNRVCAGILDNTAVFKRDEKGGRAFDAFMNKLSLEEIKA